MMHSRTLILLSLLCGLLVPLIATSFADDAKKDDAKENDAEKAKEEAN